MNNLIWKFIVVAVLSLSAHTTFATVGGPTNIYDLKYDTNTKSIYYTEKDSGGRGCPPELISLSLNNAKKIVVPCDDEHDPLEKINGITANFSTLESVNLRTNAFGISVDEVGVEKFEEGYVFKTNFVATIFQNKKKIAAIPFSGCSSDQPLVVAGYSIPGESDRVALLFSTKRDCMEGGYVYETLYVVPGVNLVKDENFNTYKYNESLVPNEGTLVMYLNEGEKPFSKIIFVASLIVAFILGMTVYMLKNKRYN